MKVGTGLLGWCAVEEVPLCYFTGQPPLSWNGCLFSVSAVLSLKSFYRLKNENKGHITRGTAWLFNIIVVICLLHIYISCVISLAQEQ